MRNLKKRKNQKPILFEDPKNEIVLAENRPERSSGKIKKPQKQSYKLCYKYGLHEKISISRFKLKSGLKDNVLKST